MALRVAVIGRPNVGKSTLFNRLAGKKLAIVHDRPGVTRDRREATARFGDLDLILIDTAGFEDATGDKLEARMRQQTEAAVREADVSLMVIDARAGITGLDRTFAAIVRKNARSVIVIANKCEGSAGDVGVAEAYGLGLGEPIPISAEHGEGMADLYAALAPLADAEAEERAAAVKQEEAEAEERDETRVRDLDETAFDEDKTPMRVAVVGRPNAGKSTLINALLGEERLITGPEPGVTRDAIAVRWRWQGRDVRICDTAGLRKRAKVEDAVERLSTQDTVRAIQFAEVVVLVLDATNAFEKQDLQIADLAMREGRALALAVTKWDLIEDKQAALAELRLRARELLPQAPGAPIIALSGQTGRGVDALMPAVVRLRKDWNAKVKTRDLNDWLAEAVARHPPPAIAGRRIKPRYIAQMKSRPPTFVLMCSRGEALPEAYKRYLINGIREAFELPGVPVRLFVRSGKNPFAKGEKRP